MTEHIAYVIAETAADAYDIYAHWSLASHEERRALESWQIVFKGETDARYMLARHIEAAKPGDMPEIWELTVEASKLDVAPSRTGTPPYKWGDLITVFDSRYNMTYRAEVTEVLLAGASRPWIVHFESTQPVDPHHHRHIHGSLEADDDGTSPNIVKEA